MSYRTDYNPIIKNGKFLGYEIVGFADEEVILREMLCTQTVNAEYQDGSTSTT